jgi:pimeloyl-ACP methyl ester carboxylesterase
MSLRQLLRSWYMFFFQVRHLPEWLIRRQDFRVLEKSFQDNVGRKGSFTANDVERYKEAARQPGALTAAVNYYRANVFERLFARSKEAGEGRKIHVPTLFIFGEQDFAILPRSVRGLEKHIAAEYREVRIPDSGHWVQNEAPGEVNAALFEFLARRVKEDNG